MAIQVRALRIGYYDNKRFREGALFEMDEKSLKYDDKGELVSPTWVELVERPAVKAKAKKRGESAVEPDAQAEQDVI